MSFYILPFHQIILLISAAAFSLWLLMLFLSYICKYFRLILLTSLDLPSLCLVKSKERRLKPQNKIVDEPIHSVNSLIISSPEKEGTKKLLWWRRERLKSCHNFRRIVWSRWEFRTHSISFPPSTIGGTVFGWIGLDRTGLNWHMLYFYCAWTTIIIFALNSLTFNISIAIPLPNRLRASFIFLTLSHSLRACFIPKRCLHT